jgi:hypothetical protein
MTETEQHLLVDALPDESLRAAVILLRRAQDPVAAKLDAAPFDDEELTEEDLRVAEEVRSEPGVLGLKSRRSRTLADSGWRIEIRPAALKSLHRLGRKDRERIRTAIEVQPEGDSETTTRSK